MGLLLAVAVTAAHVDDAKAAPQALAQLSEGALPRLRLLWADQKYHNHALYAWVAEHAHYHLDIVRRQGSGFQLLPRRWVAERTIAWLKRCRRLSVDREKTVRSAVAMVRLAMIRLMLDRLYPSQPQTVFRYRIAS